MEIKSLLQKLLIGVFIIQLNARQEINQKKIETHIKKMKSKKYIQNLKIYPEIPLKLLVKYARP